MGRLVTAALVAATVAALIGALTGALILAAIPIPSDNRVWFIWLCAVLMASAAAMATLVYARVRNRVGPSSSALATVLIGGCTGSLLALRMYGAYPQGKQLLSFAIGALVGGCAIAVFRRIRRVPRRPLGHLSAGDGNYSPAAARCLVDGEHASWRNLVVDDVLEKRSRGRWFQFTLGSLMAFTLIASVALALWVRGPIKRRQVVTAVERSGGGRVRYASQAPQWVADLLGDVAHGVFDEVSEIELRNPTDEDVKRIAVFTHLRSLSLAGTITDEAMETVAKWKSLERLDLGATLNVSNQGLAKLRNLPRLTKLTAPESLNDASLHEISSLEHLATLRILGWFRPHPGYVSPLLRPITADGFKQLAKLKQLRELSFAGVWIGDDDIAFLEQLPRLKRLELASTDVSDEGLHRLAPLEELEWLNLTGTNVTGVGFEQLLSLRQLQRLELGGTHVTDRGLEAIGELKSVKMLDLNGTRITDRGLSHLASLHLSYLDISALAVTDASLPHLEAMTDLAIFRHEHTQISDAGMKRLERAWRERRTRIQLEE